MSEKILTELLNLTENLYLSKITLLSNRLLAIRHSSLLDENIGSSVNCSIMQLDEYIQNIKSVTEKPISFAEKFKSIREVESKIRREEDILALLEDVTDTFVSNRSLSTALSALFEYFYKKTTNEDLPFLVTSKGGDLSTFPYLKTEDDKIIVGTIGMPLYSDSHLYEWILAGHELGHILANKMFPNIQLGYSQIDLENYKMELLSDRIALRIFGPVFLEALLMKLTGTEPTKKNPFAIETHPPESWRIWMCYFDVTLFDFSETKPFLESIRSIIDEIYPRPETKIFTDIKKEFDTNYDLDKIRTIKDLKECYKIASELSSNWIEHNDTSAINLYSPDQIVIAGYLTSRKDIKKSGLYTQQVINSLICNSDCR